MDNRFITTILRDYEIKRDKAKLNQQRRQKEVYSKVPRIKEIDEEINKTGLLISKAVINNPDSYEENMQLIKKKMNQLKQEKAFLMTENNIPLEYLDINYSCNKCKDIGFMENGNKCSCFKQALISKAYEMSNIDRVLKKENFQTFNISVFSPEPFEDEELSPRQNMMDILNTCEGFCINFDQDNEENLLFYGTTGLGKTFMCNCIAKALLDKGKIVIYQTAFKILEIIEGHKFRSNNHTSINPEEYSLLFNADLLIIDDLGTELTNTFTNTEIFNIVNSRLISGKKTVISTNLSPVDFAKFYTGRIFSRVFNKFVPLRFYGPDLRWE